MGKLYLKGIQEPLIIDERYMPAIQDLMSQKKNEETVETDRGTVRIGNIKMAINAPIQAEDLNQAKIDKEIRDWYFNRREFIKQTPKEKAMEALKNQFVFYWRCCKSSEMTEEIKLAAANKAMEFYKNNPERMAVDMNVWREIVKGIEPVNILEERGLVFLQKYIDSDIEAMKSEKEYREKMDSKQKEAPEEINAERLF